jgi:AGCS family alanine or glycine:cation symporter
VAAAAKTRNPVRQALVSASGTFWDTVVICAITGIVIVSSVLSNAENIATSVTHLPSSSALVTVFKSEIQEILLSEDGGVLTHKAFSYIPYIGTPLLLFGLFTFAFSTILGWSLYAQRAVEYLLGYKAVKIYTWIFLVAVFAGSIISLDTVWTLADVFNALMAIPNLFALILLSGVIAKDTDKYLWSGNLDEEGE